MDCSAPDFPTILDMVVYICSSFLFGGPVHAFSDVSGCSSNSMSELVNDFN